MTTNKKPRDRGNPKYSLLQVMGTLAAAGVAAWAILYYAFGPGAEAKPMVVEVRMDNQCGLIEGAFMASSSDGAKASFKNGVALLATHAGEKVWIRNSEQFPKFGFETDKVKAEPVVNIVAKCQPMGSIDTTMNSMRDQFKSKGSSER
jgi:hypothetical protein